MCIILVYTSKTNIYDLFLLPMPWVLVCGDCVFLFFDMDYTILHTEVRQ